MFSLMALTSLIQLGMCIHAEYLRCKSFAQFYGISLPHTSKKSYMPVLHRLRIYCQMEVCKKKNSIYILCITIENHSRKLRRQTDRQLDTIGQEVDLKLFYH